MKASIFNPLKYQGKDVPYGWPSPPGSWRPEAGRESMQRAFELFDVAVEHGFDWLTVAEHHYSQAQLAPSPVVAGAAISSALPRRQDRHPRRRPPARQPRANR